MTRKEFKTRQGSREKHNTIKHEDGWYNEGWTSVITGSRKRRYFEEKAKTKRKILRRYNLQYSNDAKLPKAIHYLILPGVVVLAEPPCPEDLLTPDALNLLVSAT